MKLPSLRGTLLSLTLAVAPLTSPAASILLFDDNTNLHNAQTALNNLGLTYTVANVSTFNGLLTGSTWDLVVLDIPSNAPTFGDLNAYVAGGGKAILSYWDLGSNATLATAFGVTVASSLGSPADVYAWDAGHPIWNSPSLVSSPITGWLNTWSDDGDKFVLSGATMVGGFTATSTAGQGAIGIGNGGRTIANGFLFDEIGNANGVQLISNEITFLLGTTRATPDGGLSVLLFGSTVLVIASIRRRLR